MKKIVKLIDNIEYDYKSLEHRKANGELHSRDTNNIIFKNLSLERVTYTSEDVVNITDELIKVSNEITQNFKDTFIDRGKEATEEQIYFANETAKIILGEFKDNIICVDPAPCGFGKSTIKLELMKYFTRLYEDDVSVFTNGVIIVGDRLADLKELQQDLGEYSKYTFLLESWNEDVCKDSSKKFAEPKMCKKCTYASCKIKIQSYEQRKYPILLITNARLQQFGESIGNQFRKWNDGERNILLIDERPQIMDSIKVNKALMNEIDTYISNLAFEDMKDKTELLNCWKKIEEMIEDKMIPLREKYKRFIISNNSNIGVCKDDERFMKLWNKYMKYDYKKELSHIHSVLTKGGFYVCESNKEFISTIGTKNLRENYKDFKTIIFDGSALYDPQYISMYDEKEEDSDLKFLYIPNTRTYENLNITAYAAHKINKTEFRNKKYLIKAVGEFVKNKSKLGFHKSNYLVTYREQSSMLGEMLKDLDNILKMNDGKSFYFGNTKGSNAMERCTRMFQIGWDVLPDYETAIVWLSCTGTWDKLLEICLDKENAIGFSKALQKADRDEETRGIRTFSSGYKNYCFGFDEIDQFQYLDTVSKFYQEIHRTKLRDYSYDGEIEVYLFQTKQIIYEMIKALLPKVKFMINKDNLNEFLSARTDNRKPSGQKEKTNSQILKECLESYAEGEIVKISDIIDRSGLTRNKIDSIRDKNKGNKWCIEWFKTHKTNKKGTYKT